MTILYRCWRRKWKPTPALLPGKSHGHRSLVRYCPWGQKESYMTEQLYLLTYLQMMIKEGEKSDDKIQIGGQNNQVLVSALVICMLDICNMFMCCVIYMCTHMYVCMCVCIYIHRHIYMYIYIYIYINPQCQSLRKHWFNFLFILHTKKMRSKEESEISNVTLTFLLGA